MLNNLVDTEKRLLLSVNLNFILEMRIMKILIIVLSSISILFLITAIDYGFGTRSGRMPTSAHMTVALIAAGLSIISHGLAIAFFPRKRKTKEKDEN